MISNALLQALRDGGVRFQTEYSLKEHISFRLPCVAALAVQPRSEAELCHALRLLDAADVRSVVLGRGSNVFFAKARFDGAVVLTRDACGCTWEGNTLLAACGASLTALATRAAEASLSGLEFAFGIPGSLGGAVYMNAGAYGGQMSDVVVESRAYDREHGVVCTVTEHGFTYRHSVYMQRPNWVCLGATLLLRSGEREHIVAKMQENMQARREKQPLEYPSVGSYFKRPEGYFAGKLIEDCGLKGFSVGGARVSEKHAGFLINTGNATAEDVLRLEEEVRARVLAAYGVTLEREACVIE